MKPKLSFILATLLTNSVASGHHHTDTQVTTIVPVVTQRPGDTAKLSIRLVDDATGKDLPGCIRIREKEAAMGTGPLAIASLLPRGLGLAAEKNRLGWYVVPSGRATIGVPKGNLVIQAISGVEYSSESIETNSAEIEIRLKRIFDPLADHWFAGNTHLHLKKLDRETADRYLAEVPRGDGLNVVFVSYLERALSDSQYISNRYTVDDLKRLDTGDLIFGSGEEYRHNTGGSGQGYGHVLLLAQANRILPASIGPGITREGTDGTPLRPGIDRARNDGGTVIWCHNAFGLEDLPNWLTDRIDAQNIFDGGNLGSYEDTFYRYLNLGMQVSFSTGTDWFLYDFSRVYVRLRPGQLLTTESWLGALRDGRTMITNGPWIDLKVGDATIGDTINLHGPKRAHVLATATGGHTFESLEIVSNGRVVKTSPATQGVASVDFEFEIREPCWIAARIKPDRRARNELAEPLFAHTSPIYFEFDGRATYVPESAAEVIADLRESIQAITKNGIFASDSERDGILAIYRDAIGLLAERSNELARGIDRQAPKSSSSASDLNQ